YRREDVGERVMEFTGKAGVDVVIEVDLAANARLLPSVIAPTGWSQSTAAARPRRPSRSSSCCRTASTSNFFWFTRSRYSCAQALTEITRMLQRGELMRNVGQTFALADIAAAHEAVESGKGDGQRGGQPRLAHLLALRADFCAEPQQARVDFL